MTKGLVENMLVLRLEGVTEADGRPQSAGLIHCIRGRIAVLDGRRMGARVYECNEAARPRLRRRLPDVVAP
jgi:hypothetical protein